MDSLDHSAYRERMVQGAVDYRAGVYSLARYHYARAFTLAADVDDERRMRTAYQLANLCERMLKDGLH